MSEDSLGFEIRYVLDDCNTDLYVGIAALNDLMRALHEVHVKAGFDQLNLPSQVQTVFGSTVAHHLVRVVDATELNFQSFPTLEGCPLHPLVVSACRDRGISLERGTQLYSHFIKALDEERTDDDGNLQSPLFLIYRTLGDEAAYHLGGLYVGDSGDIASTELQYIDGRVRRFRSLVDRWEMERQWELEDQE